MKGKREYKKRKVENQKRKLSLLMKVFDNILVQKVFDYKATKLENFILKEKDEKMEKHKIKRTYCVDMTILTLSEDCYFVSLVVS